MMAREECGALGHGKLVAGGVPEKLFESEKSLATE